jgi:hypothetical protein
VELVWTFSLRAITARYRAAIEWRKEDIALVSNNHKMRDLIDDQRKSLHKMGYTYKSGRDFEWFF